MTQPFSPIEIARARRAPFRTVLEHLGAYVKADRHYTPLDPSRRSLRLHVNYNGRDYRLVITGEKFVNDLVPHDTPNRGGGGAIDLVKHVTGFGFVQSVKVCLDAIDTKQAGE